MYSHCPVRLFLNYLSFVLQRESCKTLEEASSTDENGLSATHNILGFLGTVATTILITKYSEKTAVVDTMKKEEEALLQ
ncbi:hypothetical protein DY000_02027096 [Brassica cretica]|uniref:Uncharacterized protein n=1 Tax=Brassica cretica TaxID=69181 RepID=A0ABQ7E0A2_BRACR|nr:hypothetical protein DY000_02027096 [Brassica cretica]